MRRMRSTPPTLTPACRVTYSRNTMARERAKSFADRLPNVVPREEQDISHLSDEMVDILYPGRRPRPFRMGIRFAAWPDEVSIAAAPPSSSQIFAATVSLVGFCRRV